MTEAALMQAKAGEEVAFEEAMRQAAPVIAGARGYVGHHLERCVETKGRYLLLVRWESVEAHTQGFRESAAFVEWRRIIGPHLDGGPMVQHYENVLRWGE